MKKKIPTGLLIFVGLVFAMPAIAQRVNLTPEEQHNKEIALEFWRVVLQAGDVEKAGDYYAVDMIQHNPNVPTGLAGFKQFFSRFAREVQPVQDEVIGEIATMVDGDLVTIMRVTHIPEPENENETYEAFNFDTFRLENGMIVEHWDAARKPTP
jgi:predicted SnoaL-like aldol condensation-catalyzing enzyme